MKSIAPWIAIALTALLSFGGIVAGQAVTKYKVDSLQTQNNEQRVINKELMVALSDVKTVLASIKTEQELTRQELQYLRNDLKRR